MRRQSALDIFYSLDGEFRTKTFSDSLSTVKNNGGYISINSLQDNIIKYTKASEDIWEEHYISTLVNQKRIRKVSDQNKIALLEKHLLNN